jgi:hypothetical protein
VPDVRRSLSASNTPSCRRPSNAKLASILDLASKAMELDPAGLRIGFSTLCTTVPPAEPRVGKWDPQPGIQSVYDENNLPITYGNFNPDALGFLHETIAVLP